MREHTCCVTGHRDLTPEQAVYACLKLSEEVIKAVSDGYTRFLTGLAEGADQLFAENVLIVRKFRPEIKLTAAISHRGRLEAKDREFQRLLSECDEVTVLSEGYHRGVYAKRNLWMLSESSRLIAAWDGRERGGTFRTIGQAEKAGIEIRRIELPALLTT